MSGVRCAYCRESPGAGALLACDRCGTLLHGDCALDHGGCVTLGCRGSSFASASGRRSPTRRALGGQRPPAEPRAGLRSALAALDEEALIALGLAGIAALLLA